MLDRFKHHLAATFLRQAVTDSVLDGASQIVDRYSLRAYDSIQLAGCLALKVFLGTEEPIFVAPTSNWWKQPALSSFPSLIQVLRIGWAGH